MSANHTPHPDPTDPPAAGMRDLITRAITAGPSRSGIEAISQLWMLVLDSPPDQQPPALAQVLFGRVTSWQIQEGSGARIALVRGAPNLEVTLLERDSLDAEITRLEQVMLALQPLLKDRDALVRGNRISVRFDDGFWSLVLRGDPRQMYQAADVFSRSNGLSWGPLT